MIRYKEEVVEVIPPRDNETDASAAEQFLASLQYQQEISLEIGGDANGRHLYMRGAPSTILIAKEQLRARYPRIEFRHVPEQLDLGFRSAPHILRAKLSLRRLLWFPLKTFRDGEFRTADPILGLLGALGGLGKGECALLRLVLTPAPQGWERICFRFAEDRRNHAPSAADNELIHHIGLSLALFLYVLPMLWALTGYLQHDWLKFASSVTFMLLITAILVTLIIFVVRQAPSDPSLVRQKISRPAFNAKLYVRIGAGTEERANVLLRNVEGAYQQFSLANGNSLVARTRYSELRDSETPLLRWLREQIGWETRLNVAELAALWHLPVGEGVQIISYGLSKRLLPPQADLVSSGVFVGEAVQEEIRIPVHLSPGMLAHHAFMRAKTQKGKSTLMAHLATAAMENDTSLIVIDPHGDLVRALTGLVPKHRADDVVSVDFADTQRVVGLNLLDLSQGRNGDLIIETLVHSGKQIWKENWGPRMEDSFRHGLQTLLAANEKLIQKGEPQFTLIDLLRLFQMPSFRRRLVKQYVSDGELLNWWATFWDQIYENLQIDTMNPVLTKIHPFSSNHAIRNIVAQSNSTINLREILKKKQILLVNTAAGLIGPDAAGLLSAMLLDSLNFIIREQMGIANRGARPRVLIVIDEFQSIPGVDYIGMLAELQKVGASFVLATQSLAQLDAVSFALRPALLANVANLFVFQSSAEDAEILEKELDYVVDPVDITNLPDYSCYLKAQLGRKKLWTTFIETPPPAPAIAQMMEYISAQVARHTRPVQMVEQDRASFEARWYGRDDAMVRKSMVAGDGANVVPPVEPQSPIDRPMSHSSGDGYGKQDSNAQKPKRSQDWGQP